MPSVNTIQGLLPTANVEEAYFFWKPAWEAASYYISLECANYGQQMLFGVFRDEERIQKRKFCPELFAAVKKHFDSAVSRPWYEAVVEMQQPATDWRKWDVLWQLHKDNTFLDNVAEQLLDMANISEKIVDGLAKKYA